MWPSAPGTRTPQSNVVREIDRSCRPAAHEARDFVQPLLRQHEIRPRIEIEQLLLIGGEPEEIARLLDPFDRRTGLGRDPHFVFVELRLVLRVVGLVAHRYQPAYLSR